MKNITKKHKHSWSQYSIDCPKCGLGMVKECDCGLVKEMILKKENKVVYKLIK